MTDLTFTLLRLGFLVVLWVFVLSAIGVLRRDVDGRKATRRRGGSAAAKKGAARAVSAPAVAASAAGPPVRPASAEQPMPQSSVREPVRSRPASQPSAPRLVVTSGSLRGTVLPLTSQAVLIGRAPNCTLVLDDDYSSSRHARVFSQDGAWYVEDLGSTNGTFVDNQRITGIVPLAPGHAVRIGQSIMELQR